MCLGVTLAALVLLESSAPRLGLLDHPGGHKTHGHATPVVGGLAMAIGLIAVAAFSERIAFGTWITVGAVCLVVLGVADDRHPLRARPKLAAQAAIVTFAFALDGGLLTDLGHLLPDGSLKLGTLALPFTLFALLGLINAMNMLDGVDGLAGKVAFVAFAWFAICALLTGDAQVLLNTLAILGALVAFLAFNMRLPGRARARVFMGDTGSMLLGYLLTWVAIDSTQGTGMIPPVTALWICALPILDTTAVTVRRLMLGHPPMRAARDHLHHLLAASGLGPARIAASEALLGLVFGLIGVTGHLLGAAQGAMFALFVGTAVLYVLIFVRVWRSVGEKPHSDSDRPADDDHRPAIPPSIPGGTV